MGIPTTAFPLQWPAHWKRTVTPIRSRFGRAWDQKPSIAAAVGELQAELKRMGCTGVVITSNLELKTNGLPYSNQSLLKQDCGVAVYFIREGKDLVIACDKYDRPGCSILALAKTIANMRGIDRWGCSELLSQMFSGFKALPEKSSVFEWYEVFDLGDGPYTHEQVQAVYRTLIKKYHPDNPKTGDTEKFLIVQQAWIQYGNSQGYGQA